MAQKPETRFRKKVVERLKTLPKTVVFSIQQIAIVGTPDLLICVNGRFVAWELKKDNKKGPTPRQQHNLNIIWDAGGYSACVYPENFDAEFNKLRYLSVVENTR